jgi:hypothetical protein
MQVLAMGSELGKGFSELNDPMDQRERFEEQMKLRAVRVRRHLIFEGSYDLGIKISTWAQCIPKKWCVAR